MAAEPKEVVLKSEGTPEAKPQLPKYEPVAGANLDKLIELENALKQSITNLAITDAAVKAELTQRITNDIKVLKEASIEELNDAKDKATLYDKSKGQAKDDPNKTKGLAERQEATRKQIENKIKDAAEKDRILLELDAVHNMRRTLLDQHLNKQINSSSEIAYERFNAILDRKMPVSAEPVSTDPVPAVKSKLQTEINSWTQKTLNVGNNSIHFTGEYSATSNNPRALGAAMVAKGLMNIKFNGHPVNALDAAEEAIRCGAEGFELEDGTMKALQDEKGYVYYSGDVQYTDLIERYERLQRLAAANKYAKNSIANNVFNSDQEVSPQARTAIAFGQLQKPEDHSLFLQNLTPKEQAALAMELRDRNIAAKVKPNYQLGDFKMDEHEYISHLLSNVDFQYGKAGSPKNFYRNFSHEYTKLEVDAKKIEDFKQGNDAKAVGNYIADIKERDARVQYYQQIDQLDESANPNLKNEVRAACLGAILDRSFKEYAAQRPKKDPKYAEHLVQRNSKEIMELLRGTDEDDRAQIQTLYDNYFNRALTKVRTIDPNDPRLRRDHPDYQRAVNILLKTKADVYRFGGGFQPTQEQLQVREGENKANLLHTKEDFDLYRKFAMNADNAFRGINKNPSLVEKVGTRPAQPVSNVEVGGGVPSWRSR